MIRIKNAYTQRTPKLKLLKGFYKNLLRSFPKDEELFQKALDKVK